MKFEVWVDSLDPNERAEISVWAMGAAEITPFLKLSSAEEPQPLIYSHIIIANSFEEAMQIHYDNNEWGIYKP